VLSGGAVTAKDVEMASRYLTEECSRNDQSMCLNLAWMKTQSRFGMSDRKAAMSLLAQACLNKGYTPACQPYYNMYNASLPQQGSSRPSGGRREETFLESAILGGLSILATTMTALGAAGAASQGSYSGYSTYSATSVQSGTSPSRYTPQDNRDFRQFIASVSSYGSSVRCRPGNPYC